MCYRARGCALGVNVMFTARLMRYDHDSSASGHRLYTRQKLPQPSVALLGGSDTLGEAVHILGTSTFTRLKFSPYAHRLRAHARAICPSVRRNLRFYRILLRDLLRTAACG